MARALAGADAVALAAVAGQLTSALARETTVVSAAPPMVGLVREPGPGPWLRCVFDPAQERCWVAVGWEPVGAAAGAIDALGLGLDERFRPGPLPGAPGTLVALGYERASIPSEHRLLNDLQAMVLLHDLLAEQMGAAEGGA